MESGCAVLFLVNYRGWRGSEKREKNFQISLLASMTLVAGPTKASRFDVVPGQPCPGPASLHSATSAPSRQFPWTDSRALWVPASRYSASVASGSQPFRKTHAETVVATDECDTRVPVSGNGGPKPPAYGVRGSSSL